MSKTTILEGIIAYPITPFNDQQQTDIPLFRQLLEKLISSGVHAVAPLGSTGVLPYLDDQEREAITEACISQTAGRVPVLVGVSHLTTDKTLAHARFAEKAGASALMIIPMSYWKLREEEILRHYDRIAAAVSIPIMAYNNPATGGVDMSPALLKKLLEIPNVTMIKESTGDIQRMQYLRRELGEEVAFYNGSNPLALAAFAAGARGWCTAAPNLIPELNLDFYAAVRAGNFNEARALFYQQLDLLRFIVNTGLPRSIKAGLELLGQEAGQLRAPLLPLDPEETRELATILSSIKN